MKKLWLLSVVIVSAALAAPCGALAQSGRQGIEASNVALSVRDGQATLRMTLSVDRSAVSRFQGIAVVPTFSGEAGDGMRQVSFPYVLVNGKNRNRIFERRMKFRNARLVANPPAAVLVLDRSYRGGTVGYSKSVPAEPWMENGELSLRFVVISPAGEHTSYTSVIPGATPGTTAPLQVTEERPAAEQKPAPVPVRVEVKPAAPVVIVPDTIKLAPEPVRIVAAPIATTVEATQVTRRTIEGSAYLDFETSSSTLVADYKRNRAELEVIRRAMADVSGNPGARIIALRITGYSSPDGRFATNETLARERALSLARYLQTAYRIPAESSTVSTVGEDWNGLRRMVAGSDMPLRQSILDVIDGPDHPDAKESKLRRMADGDLWPVMVEQMFPGLRRVEYRIDYEVTEQIAPPKHE